MSQKPRLKTNFLQATWFNKPKHCCDLEESTFTIIVDQCERRWKKSLLVLCKILRLFFNTLTADDNYSVLNRDNLTQPIQILLSHKQKAFSEFFAVFLKSTLNFDHLKKNLPS